MTPGQLAKRVADARVELEREVARGLAVEAAPDIIEDLKSHAIDRLRRCPRLCSVQPGLGPKTMVRLGADVQVCPECLGVGQTVQSSPHKQWAATTSLKIAALPEEKSGPLVAIQNNVSNRIDAQGFFEKMLQTSDDIIARAKIEDAEIVKAREEA